MPITLSEFKKRNQKELSEKNQEYIKNYYTNNPQMTTKAKLLNAEKEKQTAVNNLKEYVTDKGVIAGNNIYSAPNALTISNTNLKSSTPLLIQDAKAKASKNTLSYQNRTEKEQENLKKYQNTMNTSEAKNLVSNVIQKRNEESIARSNYQQEQAAKDYENSSKAGKLWQKTGGRVIDGLAGTILQSNNIVTNENCEWYSLSNYVSGRENTVSQNYKTGIGKLAGDALFQIGRTTAATALNTIAPGLGTTTYFTDMYLDQYNATMQEGYSQKDAVIYATLSTAMEGLTEKVIGSVPGLFGKGSSVEVANSEFLKKFIKNSNVNKILSSASSEGLEEFVQEFVDVGLRNLTLGENEKVFTAENFKNALYSALVGALSSGGQTAINNAFTSDVSKTLDKTIYNIEYETGRNLTENEKTIVSSMTFENFLDENLSLKEVREKTTKQFKGYKQNKVDNFINSAISSGIDVNSAASKDILDTYKKIIDEKDYNILFEKDLTNSKGDVINGKIERNANNEVQIKVNPNSEKAAEFILTHEITHAIETDSMKNLVLDYANKNAEFSQILDNAKNTYETNDITSEVLADISGELFGNQEFINNLVIKEPNNFKKLYDKIVGLANKITGNSKENLFIKDLKNKWETAYRNTTDEQAISNLNNDTKFSKGKLISGEDVIVSDDINGTHPSKQIAEQNLKSMLGIKYLNSNNNTEISIENKDIKKYLNDGYNNQKNMKLKKRISGNYGEILEIAQIDPNKSQSNYKGTNRGKQGFDYYDVNLAYPVKDNNGNIINYKYYESRLVVRKDNNNNFAYDLDGFKEKKGAVLDKTNLSIMADKSADGSFIEDNIPQSNTNVNISSTNYSMQENINNTQELDNSSFSLKQKQLEIIKNNNPAEDDYHTWIRSIDDIKTFEETLNDSDYKEYLEAGEDFDETYTAEMAKEALQTGKITVYSSYPIEQGTFVSPSKMEAESYSGNGKVYSKEVSLTDVAWIDPTQGQYAKVNPKILPTIDTSSVNVSPTSTIVPIDNNLSNDILSDNTNENNIENDLNYSSNTSLSFSEQLDLWVQGKWNNRSQLVLFKHTPQLYLELGLNDNPITVSASKLDRIINASGKQNGTYHNLGLETTKQLPNAIANPLNILESSTIDDSIVVVTKLSDKEGRIVIVSLAIDGKGHIEVTDINNNNEIKRLSSNVMTSAYGRNNYETWMESNRDRIIYDKDDGIMKKRINGEWLQLPKGTNPFIENNIPQSDANVKSTSTKYSMQNGNNNSELQSYLEENYKSNGKKTYFKELNIPKSQKVDIPSSKTLNPVEISKLRPETADTTPTLNTKKYNKSSDENSKFYNNIKNKVNMLSEDAKSVILSEDEVKYYDKVTNEESLTKAYERLNKGGEAEVHSWLNKKEMPDATDVAEGWILLKRYADNVKNTEDLVKKEQYSRSMVEVAKRLRDIGTMAGQTVQAFNILQRMTPEGMIKYAQSELSEAFKIMKKNKTKMWLDKYQNSFELNSSDVSFIMDTMEEISKIDSKNFQKEALEELNNKLKSITDSKERKTIENLIKTLKRGDLDYYRKVKLAQIQKLMTDKLPPQKGAKIKSWMRISMLFNAKTQVRNVVGNALIMPVNAFGDLFSSYADKMLAKKTGVRTTGTTNVKSMLKGMKKGAFEATNDYKMGINTKSVDGNRFEISSGKSFSDKNIIGKTLNRTESLLNYVMDVGDRVFSEAAFENSLQNQMVLNNTTEITQEMIDIAYQEALSRTWNDNNAYTQAVLGIRAFMNKAGLECYGMGDVLIAFAKTPANLTKAIYDYSPAGFVTTLNKYVKLNRSLSNGQYTSKMQHEFVQSLGKATAGTTLYILGLALAKASITTGENDDDKDTSNFLKNTLGISSYSIKIGNKTFQYDWAQPLAAPLSITANIVKSKNNKGQALLEGIVSSLDTAGSVLLEQSFLQGINDVINNNDGLISGLGQAILELPARAIPTFSKQIADMVDGTQRTSYEYGKPLKTALNSALAKIPGASKTLAPAVDTMGREIQKYGGKNNIFNVFLNPANVNTENISKSAAEINRLYNETGDKTLMPRVASYYVNKDNEKIILSSKQRAEFQKVSGNIIESSIEKLLKNSAYNGLSIDEQADVINNIVNYSYNVAQSEVLDEAISKNYKKAYAYSKIGNIGDFYLIKSQEFTADKDDEGNSISGSKKLKVVKYINGLNLNVAQKAILCNLNGYSMPKYDETVINYVLNKNISNEEKTSILEMLDYEVKGGKVYVD